MGEVPGEGILTRGDAADAERGVGISVGELAEPDDSLEETDNERGRPRGNAEGIIGIGLEETVFSVGVRLFDMMVGGKKAQIPNGAPFILVWSAYFRPFTCL